jgi:DNA-binding transcriptional regulator YhcF (GntR family)
VPVPVFQTIAEQVASHLRGDLMRGVWSDEMPGVNRLAPKLGIDDKTVEVALRQLEKE